MLDRLQSLADRYEKLSELLCDPDVANDSKKLRDYSKEQSDLQPAYEAYVEYKNVMEELEAAKTMQGEKMDDEMREMVKMEIDELSARQVVLEETIRILLLPKDPNDDKNVIIEIRGAAGGDEAALFASDLYRMYTRFADTQGWKVELMDVNMNDLGGFKEVIFMINGRGAYSKMKFESGAHRVQRIPTPSRGEGFIRRPRPWPSCQKRKKWILRFMTRIFVSIRSVPVEPAASPLIQPNRPCALHISRRVSWLLVRMANRRTPIKIKHCRYFVPVSLI
ncbi:peptide chain release factor 1 [Paenibacillus sp. JCM 10914]|nr:peptide chain release factor 1 [Paenibacillus sp. JCM 10914]